MSDPKPAVPPHLVAHAERRIAKLDRLSDKGMRLVDAIPEDGSAESVAAYNVGSRAVRLTLALEQKIAEILAAWLAGERPSPRDGSAGRRRGAAADQAAADGDAADGDDFDAFDHVREGRRGLIRELVVDVADHEIPDPRDYDDFLDALDERLIFDEAYRNIEDLPMRAAVESLCADLKLNPDWRRWTGDGWKADPPLTRRRCSLFARPSARPILDDGPDPDPRE